VLARHVRNRRLYDAIDQWDFCSLRSSPGARTSEAGDHGVATTTSDEQPATSTTKPSAPSATASSASSTAASATAPSTTKTPPGHTANKATRRSPLDTHGTRGV
jgi:hypothetical protein